MDENGEFNQDYDTTVNNHTLHGHWYHCHMIAYILWKFRNNRHLRFAMDAKDFRIFHDLAIDVHERQFFWQIQHKRDTGGPPISLQKYYESYENINQFMPEIPKVYIILCNTNFAFANANTRAGRRLTTHVENAEHFVTVDDEAIPNLGGRLYKFNIEEPATIIKLREIWSEFNITEHREFISKLVFAVDQILIPLERTLREEMHTQFGNADLGYMGYMYILLRARLNLRGQENWKTYDWIQEQIRYLSACFDVDDVAGMLDRAQLE